MSKETLLNLGRVPTLSVINTILSLVILSISFIVIMLLLTIIKRALDIFCDSTDAKQ